ncbi:Nif3-like dinuclear metal center hexameric protein [Rhodoluna limnophila]|uniref:Nif3-like dinuclear metal center hexameric protein n=1 Tax=Rhodoluna limnophila TaxID=232537 RepID=UPI0011067EED|nr:Nif3-like dinuclear metal center hexameric protein [Rhodoluna limnophila]
MSVPIQGLIDAAEVLWPTAGAEGWDAPGLVSGSARQQISRVLLTVDVTSSVLDEAIDGAFEMVISHHPFLMRGVTSLSEQTSKGHLISRAVRAGVSLFAAHTNADIVQNGVSDVIAKAIGLANIRPLVESSPGVGHGRIGTLPEEMPLGELARRIAKVMPSTATGVRVSGEFTQLVQTVALCGGAGDSFIGDAISSGADVYMSSDLRHHPVQDAREYALTQGTGPAIIDVSHWASEWLWLDVAANQLSEKFPQVQFVVSQLRTDPWDFVITQ